MKYLIATLLALAALSTPALSPAQDYPGHEPLKAIPALDVPRYMGIWYEIAKYPNWFQRNCHRETQATYRLADDGQVSVTNRCRTRNGEWIEAIGQARQIGGPTSPQLQVRFAPAWLSFLPFVWGNYWIIDLDEAYQVVAVSEPSREYLWILTRTPTIGRETYEALLARLAKQGFDLRRIERTHQD